MTTFSQQDLEDLLGGAILYGSGGGGPTAMGQLMMKKVLAQSKQPDIAEASDMGDEDWAVIVAGVGSPAAASDFDPSVAVEAVKYLEKSMGVSFGYMMAAEIGAGNSFMPIYVAAELCTEGRDVKALDVAGSDRAVPSITMSTFAAGNVPVSHIMVANHDHHVGVTVDGAEEASKKLRQIVSEPQFGQVAGVAIWPMQGKTVKQFAVPGTYQEAIRLGRALRAAPDTGAKAAEVARVMQACTLGRGTLTTFDTITGGGYDTGRAIVSLGAGSDLVVLNKNENLLAWRTDLSHPVAIGPDLISYMCAATGTPFSNAEAKQYLNKEIIVFAAPASDRMRQDPIVSVFREAMATMGGYPGPAVPLAQLG